MSGLDRALDAFIEDVIATAEAAALARQTVDISLYDILRYHLGFVNERLEPERVDPGKRIRSKLCVYTCIAAGGATERALPVAAAIELLHNFTLIHDDIQDRSLLRRHRPAIWATWGDAQAINAGDAMFVLAQLALNRLVDGGVEPGLVLALSDAMQAETLRIVEGQVLDLGYEARDDVAAAEYLTMIAGKTAAICRFAAWSGAVVAGASPERADRFAEFGQALGIGFQLRDDVLGIWGDAGMTGKDAGDIRRKKKSFPTLLLFERARSDDRNQLRDIYARPELGDEEVRCVMSMLDRYEVEESAIAEAERWHTRAASELAAASPVSPGDALLNGLVEQLATRSH